MESATEGSVSAAAVVTEYILYTNSLTVALTREGGGVSVSYHQAESSKSEH